MTVPENNHTVILVAESDGVNRSRIVSAFQARGYGVEQAVDGGSAFHVIRSRRKIDLIVAGRVMAPVTGFELAQTLLANGYDIPILMICDSDPGDLIITASRYNIRRIFNAPVEPDILCEAAARLFREKGRSSPHILPEKPADRETDTQQ